MEMVLRIFLARCLLGYFHHQQEENKSPLLRLMRLHGSKPVHLQILFYPLFQSTTRTAPRRQKCWRWL